MTKGYFTENGYYGYVDGEYILFEGEEAYYEYLEEMNMEIKRITHPEYGTGTILKVEKTEEGYWVTVYFDEVGDKKLLSFVDPTKE